jgi:hypothetical protein
MIRTVLEIEHDLATAHHRVLDLERELIEALRSARIEVDVLRSAYEVPSGATVALKAEYIPHDLHG